MDDALNILAATLLGFSVAGLVYWSIVYWRVRRTLANRPTVREGLSVAPPESDCSVSIVIPAHNEERVIEASVEALRRQRWPDLEIIYVLDRCSDRTLELLQPHAAADDRVKIVENDHCPEGWAGKCHAAWVGAKHATGKWLLFSDADTIFDPDLTRAAVALSAKRGWSLMSLLSTLTCDHAFERIAQPVATISLMRMYPLYRVSSHDRTRPFANGQFMLFDREAYEAIDGHHGVKNELLEDLAFARLIHARDGKLGVLLADGMLTCSMYDTWKSFATGWRRIFIEACRRKPRRLRKIGIRLFVGGIGLPLVYVATLIVAGMSGWFGSIPGMASVAGVVASGVVIQALTLTSMYALGGAPASAAISYPVGCLLVGRILLAGASDLAAGRPVAWGGKEYVLKPR